MTIACTLRLSLVEQSVLKVLDTGDFRTVSPGPFTLSMGLTILDDVLHTANSNTVYGYDVHRSEEAYLYEPAIGTGGRTAIDEGATTDVSDGSGLGMIDNTPNPAIQVSSVTELTATLTAS